MTLTSPVQTAAFDLSTATSPRAGILAAFVFVGLNSQAEADLVAFEEKVRGWPIVRECHLASGEIDFVLRCVAPDLRAFQNFVIEQLTKAAHVESVRTSLVLRRVKDEAAVPMDGRQP
jgi:DNA-binding Lrp family transcriptional regulator